MNYFIVSMPPYRYDYIPILMVIDRKLFPHPKPHLNVPAEVFGSWLPKHLGECGPLS